MVSEGKKKGIDVSGAEKVIKDIERFFYSNVNRSQNDAFSLDLRDRVAKTIVNLKTRLN